MGAHLEALEAAHEGEIALPTAFNLVCNSVGSQFVHQYVRVPDEKYTVRHKREGCEFCDAIEIVEQVLTGLKTYAREQLEEQQDDAYRARTSE